MPDVFHYTDYRRFLQDYYNERKAENKNFSYEILSQKIGSKSKGFVHNIVKGLRNISGANAFRLAEAMKLSKKETEYFENLVAFNQAKSLNERNHLFEKLTSIQKRGREQWAPKIVKENQYEFYSKYYHSVIRSLIGLAGFSGDYKWLAKKVYPRITPAQARKSVQLLERLQLIKKGKDGRYHIIDRTISTPNEVKSLALLNFHLETGKLALKAISELPRDKRNVSGLTLGISGKAYEKVCEEINKFRNKILKISEEDEESDSVFRLNLQFFPVSESNIKGGAK